ncbi:peroxidase 53-like [Pistacia vera]|uniref:peroxidase 53-like n=1 Tax=Pistacia vera TaxID=55513 RepID=UPI0012634E56|nr:peroxidase 53-like [Pistacia vera]
MAVQLGEETPGWKYKWKWCHPDTRETLCEISQKFKDQGLDTTDLVVHLFLVQKILKEISSFTLDNDQKLFTITSTNNQDPTYSSIMLKFTPFSGAHTFGSARALFSVTVYTISVAQESRPKLGSQIFAEPSWKVPDENSSFLNELDPTTPKGFDNNYFTNLKRNFGLLQLTRSYFYSWC